MAEHNSVGRTFSQAVVALSLTCVFAGWSSSTLLIESACAENADAAPSSAGGSAAADADKYIVTGRVTNVEGQAVASATIECGRGDTSFQRRIRVRTGADGKYTLSLKSLDDRSWLAASAPGYCAKVGKSQFTSGRQVQDFVLAPMPKEGEAVAGVVVDEHNKPVAGARVEALTPVSGFYSSFSMPTGGDYFPGPDRVDTTDDQGRFRIADLATDEVQLNITSKHRHINDDNYRVEEGLIIKMSGSGVPGVVQGRVVDAATKLPPKNIADIRVVPRYSTTNHKCAMEDATFRLPREVTLGETYMVYVYARGYAVASAELTAVPPDSKDFTNVELKARPALQGRLVDADTGKPVGNVPLVYGIADQMRYIEWSSLPKYADGYHSLMFVQHEISSPTGEFWFAEPESGSRGLIIVFVDGYQRLLLFPRDRRFDDATGEFIVRLKRESAFEGVVLCEGKPVHDVSVSVSGGPTDGLDHMRESVHTDAAGRYRYGRLAPGNYQVHGAQYSRMAKVGKGETAIVNLGDDLGPLRVHGKAEADVSITLSPQFRWDYAHISTTANKKGEYEIGGLKAGRYRVSLYSSYRMGNLSHQEQEIVVKSDSQQIDFLEKPIGKSTTKTSAESETKK